MEQNFAIRLFDEGKYNQARATWEKLLQLPGSDTDNEDISFNIATCYANECNFNQAVNSLKKLKNQTPDVLYNLGLCYYKLSLYEDANRFTEEAINLILTRFPMISEEDVKLTKIYDTLIVQTLNLKAAIIYKQENDGIKSMEYLNKIPIKDLSQLDCVTLHNRSVYNSHIAPEESLKKLEYLVNLMKNNEFIACVPKETIRNLIMLYIYEGLNDAASLLIQNESSLIHGNIDDNELSYFRSCFEAKNDLDLFERLDRLFHSLIKDVEGNSLIRIINSQQASLLWNNNLFEELEEYLLKTKQYTSNLERWSENMAHTLFMQDTRYAECTVIYEEMMMNHSHLSEVDPIILCNLCISYILSGKNNDAEALIKEVEALEFSDTEFEYVDTISVDTTNVIQESEPVMRLTLINLAIGTLYCVKCNYDFGLNRIIKTLTPQNRKLNCETWFIAKSCILSLLSNLCRQIVCVQDHLFDRVIQFLMQCERIGSSIDTPKPVIKPLDYQDSSPSNTFLHYSSTVAYEARLLRSIALKIFHD